MVCRYCSNSSWNAWSQPVAPVKSSGMPCGTWFDGTATNGGTSVKGSRWIRRPKRSAAKRMTSRTSRRDAGGAKVCLVHTEVLLSTANDPFDRGHGRLRMRRAKAVGEITLRTNASRGRAADREERRFVAGAGCSLQARCPSFGSPPKIPASASRR